MGAVAAQPPKANGVETVAVKGMCGIFADSNLSVGFMGGTNVTLKPSEMLLRHLGRVSKDTIIGIAWFSPESLAMLAGTEVDGKKVQPEFPQIGYWNAVLKACESAGLKVVYLEDPALMQKQIPLDFRLAEIRNKLGLDVYTSAGAGQMSPVRIERDYILAVARADAILAAIQREKPGFVIAPRGYADRFWQMQLDGKLEGVSFGKYGVEEMPDMSFEQAGFMMDLENADMAQEEGRPSTFDFERELKSLAESTKPNVFHGVPDRLPTNEYLDDVDSIKRRYRALKTGRLTDARPDYIGVGDTDQPIESLFELFIEKRGEDGRIEGHVESTDGRFVLRGYIKPMIAPQYKEVELDFVVTSEGRPWYDRTVASFNGEMNPNGIVTGKSRSYASRNERKFRILPFNDGMTLQDVSPLPLTEAARV